MSVLVCKLYEKYYLVVITITSTLIPPCAFIIVCLRAFNLHTQYVKQVCERGGDSVNKYKQGTRGDRMCWQPAVNTTTSSTNKYINKSDDWKKYKELLKICREAN